MKLLALDCAGSGCSTCVVEDGHVLALQEETMARGQDSRLMPMIQSSLARAGLTYADLDRIAVTRGPGSFTGLRIGLACARGLGLAADKPVIGIDRFAIHHTQHQDKARDLLVVLDSRRDELYTRFYPAGAVEAAPSALTPEEIATFLASREYPVLIAGDAAARLEGVTAPSNVVPLTESEAVTCARLAAALADPMASAYLPRPLYLRAPDVTCAKPLFPAAGGPTSTGGASC